MAYNDNQSPLKGIIMKHLDSAKKFVNDHKNEVLIGTCVGTLVLTGYGLMYACGYIHGSNAIDVAYTYGIHSREAVLKTPIPSN